MSVTPVQGIAVSIPVGGLPVVVFPADIAGGYIANGVSSTDQGIATPEPLYVDPVGDGTNLAGNGNTVALAPGQVWNAIPGQTNLTRVNAATSGHKFTAVYWL